MLLILILRTLDVDFCSEFFPYEDATLKQVVPKKCDQKTAIEKQTVAPKKKSQPKILQDEEKAWVVKVWNRIWMRKETVLLNFSSCSLGYGRVECSSGSDNVSSRHVRRLAA